MRMPGTIVTEESQYYDGIKKDLKSLLPSYCSTSKFDDDKWHCDLVAKSSAVTKNMYEIDFNMIPEQFRVIVKYYVLNNKNIQMTTARSQVSVLPNFFNFLDQNCPDLPLNKVTRSTIHSFKTYLSDKHLAKGTKELVWSAVNLFFRIMQGWNEVPEVSPLLHMRNPWHRSKRDKRNDNKYIPEEVVRQLDVIFSNPEEIPLHHRSAYWIMRSIPSRSSEVCGIKLDCIKPCADHYTLILPTWKVNGGYLEPESRIIHIHDKGHAKFLLDLVREQQKEALRVQDLIPEEQKDMLFAYQVLQLNPQLVKDGKYKLIKVDKYNLLDRTTMRSYINLVLKRHRVKDKFGNLYKFTPHQLRHNGITDRLEEGFELEEIRDTTGHKNNEMISSYTHIRPEVLKEKSDSVLAKRNGEPVNAPVFFQGRILNMTNQEIAEWLQKNPRRYRILKGDRSIGLCSDITSCKGGIFECIACDYFIPNADDLEYFEEQVTYWEERCEIFKNKPTQLENCKYNLALHRTIVNRIKSIIAGENLSEKGA